MQTITSMSRTSRPQLQLGLTLSLGKGKGIVPSKLSCTASQEVNIQAI